MLTEQNSPHSFMSCRSTAASTTDGGSSSVGGPSTPTESTLSLCSAACEGHHFQVGREGGRSPNDQHHTSGSPTALGRCIANPATVAESPAAASSITPVFVVLKEGITAVTSSTPTPMTSSAAPSHCPRVPTYRGLAPFADYSPNPSFSHTPAYLPPTPSMIPTGVYKRFTFQGKLAYSRPYQNYPCTLSAAAVGVSSNHRAGANNKSPVPSETVFDSQPTETDSTSYARLNEWSSIPSSYTNNIICGTTPYVAAVRNH